MRTAEVLINQSHLTHNLDVIKKHAPHSKVMVMVKANAYGHGVEACLPALIRADAIGVATYQEAYQAKQLGWQKTTVLIEGVFSETEWLDALQHNFQCVIHNTQQLTWALKHPQNQPKKTTDNDSKSITAPTVKSETSSSTDSATIWLKLNTGMNRLGFNEQDIINHAKQLYARGYHIILTSHFANADHKNHPLNQKQGQVFCQTLQQLHQQVSDDIQASLCNSAAIINFPEWHFDWVRAGISLYGSSPDNSQSIASLGLKPVMALQSKIMAIHALTAGECVGYGSLWSAKNDSHIAIVSIGYGDGYPRVIDDKAYVSVYLSDGRVMPCPIIGRVAMDMIAIDVSTTYTKTDIDSTSSNVSNSIPVQLSNSVSANIGDKVVLWGYDEHDPTIDEVATHANTISYELLCRLTSRPIRKIIN